MNSTSTSRGSISALACRLVATAAVAAVAIGAMTPPDARSNAGSAVSAAQRSKPDLVVSAGIVRTSGTVVGGSFVVRNRGRVGARRSVASLTVHIAGARRVWRHFAVPALRRSASRVVRISLRVPPGLPAGEHPIQACANSPRRLRERSTRNNCRTIGALVVSSTTTPPIPPPAPVAPTPPKPVSTVPSNPLPFTEDDVFTVGTAPSNYWIYVPKAYDETHRTPITLFVWMHGCGGTSAGDIWSVSGVPAQSFVAIAPGGREGACWDATADSARVLAAIADVKTHFNINPRRVVLGGYSSGGDLAYRTAFYNSKMFAGVLAEDTAPFRDTGSTQTASLAAASWKFHVVHLAHLQDDVYKIAEVKPEIDAMKAAGFPIELIERNGGHYDDDTPTSGTTYDLRRFLLPHLNDGWLAPAV